MRRRSTLIALLTLPPAALALWSACASVPCEDTLTCLGGTNADSGNPDVVTTVGPTDGAAEAATIINGCVIANAPKDDGCVLQDAIGIFVATNGDDSAPGTSAAPVATVKRAVALARVGGKASIFVCNGVYPSKVELSAGPGVAVYGGLDCPAGGKWTYSGKTTRFAPDDPGPVLTLDQLTSLTQLADLEIVAANAKAPSGSSVAGFVHACPGVRLDRVVLRAGDGADGVNGDAGAFLDDPPAKGGDAGAAAVVCTCKGGGSSTGGKGGAGGLTTATAGGDGLPNLGGTPPKDGAHGNVGPCSAGHEGADGRSGDGGLAATGNGSVTATGYVPAAATPGGNGTGAQGGGGGGGSISNGGGGGGCGGCGGQSGAPGGAGGASLGLVVSASNVRLGDSHLFTGKAGNGGIGGPGESGHGGGPGGFGACAGGLGGRGGNGGGGSGGRGGHSIAIVYAGDAPILTQTTLETADAGGAGGNPGNIGTPGVGEVGRPGLTGTVVELP